MWTLRSTKAEDLLTREPYIDVYWDNASGEMLEVAIKRSAFHVGLIVSIVSRAACGGFM